MSSFEAPVRELEFDPRSRSPGEEFAFFCLHLQE